MLAPKTLRPPSNWQDFEALCLELFGEFWNCPEIQKNGEEGQDQKGVDIFCKPSGIDGYYGIQCKGKKDYKKKKFTEKEILEQVEMAKQFKPSLKKYFLVTTASDDSKIQEYVRELDLKNQKEGLFDIHVYGWETLVRYIDKCKSTHDWYVKSQNYKTKHDVTIAINDCTNQVICTPKFEKENITYELQTSIIDRPDYYNSAIQYADFTISGNIHVRQINYSYFPIEIILENTGNEAIKEIKVQLKFEGEIEDFLHKNVIEKHPFVSTKLRTYHNTLFNKMSNEAEITPEDRTLLKGDSISSEIFFIKPLIKDKPCVIKMHWKLLSLNFSTEGTFDINVIPEIHEVEKTILVKVKPKEKYVSGNIRDMLVDIKE